MRFVLVFPALLALLLAPSLANAQGAVGLEIEAGYQGYYSRAHGPTPVRVRLTNSGASFRARVEVDSLLAGEKVTYFTDVDLPQNSEKVVTLYPGHTGFNVSTRVRVLNGEQVVAETAQKMNTVEPTTRLIGVLSPELGTYVGLRDNTPGAATEVALLSSQTLPDRADALTLLSAVVVDGASTDALTDAQRQALRSWVELGGDLIIAGGPDAARTAAGLSELLPVRLGATQDADDLAALGQGATASRRQAQSMLRFRSKTPQFLLVVRKLRS
ncbi:MAG: hypothetical protein WKH64_14680 [Chloroflexia bacterium]